MSFVLSKNLPPEKCLFIEPCSTLRHPTFQGCPIQGYLAHKKQPSPPKDYHRPLGMGLLQGPRVAPFLMSEVPL